MTRFCNVSWLAVILLLLAGPAASGNPLWYNGDLNHEESAINVMGNTLQAKMFDDFVVTDPAGWTVTSIWSNNCYWSSNAPTAGHADWSIRTGMGPQNGGTIVASGDSPFTVTPTGRTQGFGDDSKEYSVIVGGLNLYLSPGTYWLNVSPYSSVDYTINMTSGANAVGTPAGNNLNAIWWWSNGAHDYDLMQVWNGAQWQGADYSLGVEGYVGRTPPVPEPCTFVLLATGGLALACRRRGSK